MSCVTCNMLCVSCHLSVTPTATFTDPSPANSLDLHTNIRSTLFSSPPGSIVFKRGRQMDMATSRLNQPTGLVREKPKYVRNKRINEICHMLCVICPQQPEPQTFPLLTPSLCRVGGWPRQHFWFLVTSLFTQKTQILSKS